MHRRQDAACQGHCKLQEYRNAQRQRPNRVTGNARLPSDQHNHDLRPRRKCRGYISTPRMRGAGAWRTECRREAARLIIR
jgi:hypothetical protein